MIIFPGLLGSIAAVKSPGIVTDGLILHLDAENLSSYPGSGTTWEDLTANNNDGTLYNGVAFQTNQYNQKVFNFDNTNDYIQLPNNVLIPHTGNPFSISIWFYAAATSGMILGQVGASGGYVPSIYVDNDGKLRTSCFWGGSPIQTISTNTVLNDWHNITVTFESGYERTYIDGVLDQTLAKTQTFYASTYYYYLGYGQGVAGGWPSISDDYFSGSISHVLIYTKSLSEAEITQNYNALSPRYIATITGYVSGTTTFTTPDFTDSFEFEGNWNDAVDLTTTLSGNTVFTTPDFQDSFEFQGNWNDTVDLTTTLSGNTTFTTPDFQDSFEFQENWNDAVDIATALSGTTTFTTPDFTDSFETGSGGW